MTRNFQPPGSPFDTCRRIPQARISAFSQQHALHIETTATLGVLCFQPGPSGAGYVVHDLEVYGLEVEDAVLVQDAIKEKASYCAALSDSTRPLASPCHHQCDAARTASTGDWRYGAQERRQRTHVFGCVPRNASSGSLALGPYALMEARKLATGTALTTSIKES